MRGLFQWGERLFWVGVFVLIVSALAWQFASGPSGRTDRTPLRHEDPRLPAQPTFLTTPQSRLPKADYRVIQEDEDGALILPETADLARALNADETDIQHDFEILNLLLDAFRKIHQGSLPQGGENEEIVAQLRGRNSRRLAVIPPNHPAINASGQLLDRWGMPFYFHPLSRDVLEIRSSGKDRTLFTDDDITN